MNPHHTYAAYGNYTVTLKVSINVVRNGCCDSCVANYTAKTWVVYEACDDQFVIDKTVWNGTAWVDQMYAKNGTIVNFKITLTNNLNINLTGPFVITDYLSAPQFTFLETNITVQDDFNTSNTAQWTIPYIKPFQSIVIRASACAVHVCYGYNQIYVYNAVGALIGFDITKVKVLNNLYDPLLSISTMVWDDRLNTWTDSTEINLNDVLMFKTTVRSSALNTATDVTVTDVLPHS